MAEPLKVLCVASECAPFAKTGGLGDVTGALPKALARRGIDVRVMMPLYAGLPWDEQELLEGALEVPVGTWRERAAVRLGLLPGSSVPVYFLEHLRYFDRPGLYGSPWAYHDNLERFTFLSRGGLHLCQALGWQPDVIHVNDWQTALVPVFVNTLERDALGSCATILTIHNLAHQGVFATQAFPVTGLPWSDWSSTTFEHDSALNLLKAGLQHSTLITTVSPSYAREIQLPEFGAGLEYVLGRRAGDLHGILNGIDTEVWDPAHDEHIAAPFTAKSLKGKAVCKAALQAEVGLPVAPDTPLFGVVSRLDWQKGLDILAAALPAILDLDIQIVLLGTGAHDLEWTFAEASRTHPERFHARIAFSNEFAHRIEAGSDFFVMPSRFEPCGLNQLYSLRYGTLPIVRRTGGLADTVRNFDEATGDGTGFCFEDLHPQAVYDAVAWATWAYYERRKAVEAMRRRAMNEDFSWDRSAEEYERVYRLAVARRRG